jgi:L-2-hydroxyglutarate oxidase LhgO
MDRVDVTVIGAGVIGLAIAAKISKDRKTVVVERHESFGKETSSRNSEVIHSGIYYPTGSLKALLCVEGNPLLYAYCQEHKIPHARLEKIIVAVNASEMDHLEKLHETGKRNGVTNLQWLDRQQVGELEPEVRCVAGLLSPSTGILDTHTYMSRLEQEAQTHGALVTYGAEVTRIEKSDNGYRITILPENYTFESGQVINAAGLCSDKVAAMAGMDIDQAGYRLYFCKGDYFRTSKPLNIKRLIYPVPAHDVRSLGTHLTKDLAGGTRFGPDAEYVQTITYTVDERKKHAFSQSIQAYLPSITAEDLQPDMAGMRPKLQGPSDGFKDFLIQEESSRGLPGWINLIGMESPGLTSSLAIAKRVAEILK